MSLVIRKKNLISNILSYLICTLLIGNVLFAEKVNIIYWIFLAIASVYSIISGYTLRYISKYKFILFFIYYLYIIINGFYFKNRGLHYGIKQYIIFSLIFFSVFIVISKININKLLNFIIIFGFINSLIGIFEYFSNKYIFSKSIRSYLNGQIRVSGFSGSFIAFPMVCGFCLLISLYFIFLKKSKIYYLSALISLIGILVSSSRGPLVATFIAAIFYYIITDLVKTDGKLTLRKVITCFVVFIILIITYLLITTEIKFGIEFLDKSLSRIRSIFVWDGSTGDTSNVTRAFVWKYMINDYFLPNKWFGIGVGATGSAGIYDITIGVTESSIIKKLVELGIFGSVINFLIYILLLIEGKRNLAKIRDKDSKILILLFYAIIIQVFVEGIVFQIIEIQVAISFLWISLAIIVSYPKMLLRYDK